MNQWKCRLAALAMIAVSASALCAVPALAQRSVDAPTGIELRWHGDTIWRIRDTTMTRAVFRGDTVYRTYYRNGLPVSTTVLRVRGDVADVLAQRGASGEMMDGFVPGRTQPLLLAITERQSIEMALRDRSMRERMSSLPMPSRDAPLRPTTLQTYVLSVNLVAEHLGDTVRYIRGCTAAPPVDTTVYVFVGEDSLRRISPVPRAFGRPMARAVRGDLSSAMTRARVPAIASAGPLTDVPGPPRWPCERG